MAPFFPDAVKMGTTIGTTYQFPQRGIEDMPIN